MKRLALIIAALLTTTLSACLKDTGLPSTPDGNIENQEEDFYYVKYYISAKTYFYIDEVTYNTEKGTQSESFAAVRYLERTCGPVSKNFAARVTLTKYRGAPATNAVQISVSKNNGPFALKASGQYNASYTIDF